MLLIVIYIRFCWWLVDKLQRPSEVWKVTTLRKRSGTSWLRCRHGDVDVVRISSTDLLFPLKWRASAAAFYHFDFLVSLFYRTKKLYPLVILRYVWGSQRNNKLEIIGVRNTCISIVKPLCVYNLKKLGIRSQCVKSYIHWWPCRGYYRVKEILVPMLQTFLMSASSLSLP